MFQRSRCSGTFLRWIVHHAEAHRLRRATPFPFPRRHSCQSSRTVLSRNLLDFRATIPAPLLLNQREFRVRCQLLTRLPHTLARLVIVYGAGFFAGSRTIPG